MYDIAFPYLTLVQDRNKNMVAWVYIYLNMCLNPYYVTMSVLALTLRLRKLTQNMLLSELHFAFQMYFCYTKYSQEK